MDSNNHPLDILATRRSIDVLSQKLEKASWRQAQKLRRRKRKLVAETVAATRKHPPLIRETNRITNAMDRQLRHERRLKEQRPKEYAAMLLKKQERRNQQLHPQFNIKGTQTGRYSSSTPHGSK